MIEQTADPISGVVGTALGSSSILVGLGWLLIKSKLDSIGVLWRKLDNLDKSVTDNRLADAKEYASRAELNVLLSAMEVRLEKRLDEIKGLLDSREQRHGKN